jgi:hypothetical protein
MVWWAFWRRKQFFEKVEFDKKWLEAIGNEG